MSLQCPPIGKACIYQSHNLSHRSDDLLSVNIKCLDHKKVLIKLVHTLLPSINVKIGVNMLSLKMCFHFQFRRPKSYRLGVKIVHNAQRKSYSTLQNSKSFQVLANSYFYLPPHFKTITFFFFFSSAYLDTIQENNLTSHFPSFKRFALKIESSNGGGGHITTSNLTISVHFCIASYDNAWKI